jgi:Fe-S-cluster containining protein
MPNNISETGINIPACFCCGECCTIYQALVEEAEALKIANYLHISHEEFKKEYTDPRWPILGKFLLRHRTNGGCVFLVSHSRKFLCSIHDVKPQPCRDWAASMSRKECRQGLRRMWNLTVSELGAVYGAEQDKQDFMEHLRSISKQIP